MGLEPIAQMLNQAIANADLKALEQETRDIEELVDLGKKKRILVRFSGSCIIITNGGFQIRYKFYQHIFKNAS